jgi:Nickel responsive protein SCO4226-like
MPCFILTHGPVGEFTQERLIECGRKLMSSLPKDVRWLQGFYIPEEDSLVCHWDAPTSEAVRALLDQSGLDGIFPIMKIQEAVEVPPEWLRAKRPRGRPRQKSNA